MEIVQPAEDGSTGGLTLETNGVLNGDQSLLNLVAGTNITITDDGLGNITFDSSGGASGIASINSDTTSAQLLTVGTSGTDFAIADNGTGTHTFNLPTASATNRGALSSTDWSTFNSKQGAITFGSQYQLPVTNASGNDFTYSSGLTYDATTFDILGTKIRLAGSTADATNKAFRFTTLNYLNAQNDFLMVFGQSKSTGNTLIMGGGQTGYTAASAISFFTGSGNNTDIGTSRMSIDASGNVSIAGLTASQAVFTDSSKNLVSNAITGTGNVVMSTSPTISGATLTTSSVNGVTLATGGTSTLYLSQDGTYTTPPGIGTVTSVATDATLTGGPITTSGTLGLNLSNPNTWAALQIFPDDSFKLTDNVDPTKTAVFQLSGLTTGTNAVYTLPNLAAATLATTSTLTQTFSGTTTFSGATGTFGSSTATGTYSLGSGATLNGSTRTINIGSAGVSGSTINVTIGSATSGALGTLQLNSPTVAMKALVAGGLVKATVTSGALAIATAGTDYEVPLTFSSPLVRTTNTISIPAATTSVNGYLTSTDWNTFNGKQAALSLTTTGTSGNATLVGSTLNIPNYTYTLPTASTSVLGGVKVDGTSITITGGVISATTGGSGTVTSVASADGSITVTNPTTTVDLAVVKAPKLTTARTIGIATGDVTSSGSAFDGTANNTNAYTLATVNSNVGSFTNASVTVNAKGLVTAASNGTTPEVPLTFSSPLVRTVNTISIPAATTSVNGYLSSTDWNTFNNKVSSQWATSGSNISYTTGNVGIGTTSPTYQLTTAGVTGRVASFADDALTTDQAYVAMGGRRAFMGYNGTTSNAVIQAVSSKGIEFNVNNNTFGSGQAMVINSSGNVGIGTTSPTSLFSVGSTSQFQVNSSGAIAAAAGITSSGAINFSGLTASRLVATDASKNLVNTITLANLVASLSDVSGSTGTTNLVLSNSPTLVTPNLGTPSTLVLTNATGLPVSTGISGLATGVATFLGTPSSANLASAVTDETGSGSLVFATSPTLVTPALGTPSSGVGTNITGITAAHVVAGTFGTGAYTMDTSLTVPQVFNAENAQTASANAITFTRANRINKVTNNSAAGLTITLSTTGATAGDMIIIKSVPSSAVAQTITWVNTEVSDVTPSANLNASTTSPRTDGFMWNSLTSKWRCVASC